MGASTKIIDKWDEIAYMRDVIIAGKDCEVDDSRKLLKESDSLSKVQFLNWSKSLARKLKTNKNSSKLRRRII